MNPEERMTVFNVLGAWLVLALSACAIIGLIGGVVLEEESETYYKLFYGGGGTLLILTGAHFSMLTLAKLLNSITGSVYIGRAQQPDEGDDLAE